MKPLFCLILVSLCFSMAQARGLGPGAGGGTDVIRGSHPGAQDDVLVDFKDSYREIPIDPRTYEGIYARLTPKLERLDYYFPGLKSELEKVFKKEWKFTNEHFAPNAPGELKPVKQTENSVKITYDWFQSATAEQEEQIWLHEMVRNYAMDEVNFTKLYYATFYNDEENKATAEDQIVRAITPLIYEERPPQQIAKDWVGALYRYIYDRPSAASRKKAGVVSKSVGLLGRQTMYDTITVGNLVKRYRTFCSPSVINNDSRLRELMASFPTTRGQYYEESYFRYAKDDRLRLLSTFTERAVVYQLNSLTNDKNAYQSLPMEAVSKFALRTMSFIEGDGSNGVDEFWTKEQWVTRNMALSNKQRMDIIRTACRDGEQEGLGMIFETYTQDRGKVRDVGTTSQATTRDDVSGFFTQQKRR